MDSSRTSSKKLEPPSKVVSSKFDDVEGAKETEIAAQITLPSDGGWGWVVLAASLATLTILDGLVFTYGAILHDITIDLDVPYPSVALVGSLNYTLYLMLSPLASALINSCGFRFCGMLGGMICCFSALSSTFAPNYISFLVLYGICYGIGCSFTSMAAYLVVGFYFQKYRTVVMMVVSSGSSIGMMILSPVNLTFVHLAGWRPTVLVHSGLLGLMFFFAMTYKPLAAVTVKNTEDHAVSARLVTFLPNEKKTPAGAKPTANATERVLGAVSNTRYPTAASVIQEPALTPSPSQGTSAAASKPRLTMSTTQGLSQAQLNKVKSIIFKGDDETAIDIKFEDEADHGKKKSCWGRLCYWLPHGHSRPLYRDDAFYDGKMNKLPQYRKSRTEAGQKTSGLEYQLGVTRAATVQDLRERRGTTAVKRVLATMFDLNVLKTSSFKILCLAGVCNYLGLLTPLTYLTRRNLEAGISPEQCKSFVAVIGAFNALGRILWSFLATKVSPSYLYSAGLMVSGVSTAVSGLSYSLFYQYLYCALFGISICVSNGMRSLMVVDMYGLERLTNGTGMLLLFMGIGNVFSTPIAAILRNLLGYNIAFYFAGFFLTLGSILAIPLKMMRNNEIKKASRVDQNENKKRESVKPTVTEKGPKHHDSDKD